MSISVPTFGFFGEKLTLWLGLTGNHDFIAKKEPVVSSETMLDCMLTLFFEPVVLFYSIEQNFSHQSKIGTQYAPIRIKDCYRQIKMLAFDWCSAADINILIVQNWD